MDYLDNRELSWLKFNKRVLEEAIDPEVPLLERLSFSAIYQNNLDEFFMVRMGSLIDLDQYDPKIRENKTDMTAAQQIDAAFTAVRRNQEFAEDAFIKTINEIKEYGFEQLSFAEATDEEKQFLELYFKREIKPLISPNIIDKKHPFPFIRNKDLYIAVQIKSKKGVKVGIIPVKHENFERVIPLTEDRKRFILTADVILQFAESVFKNYEVIDKTIMRVTRNADISLSEEDEDGDFRENMERLISKRKILEPVRLELSSSFSRTALDHICKKLGIGNEKVFYSRIPLDLSYLFALGNLTDDTRLKFSSREPQRSIAINYTRPLLPQIRTKDLLLSYPYEKISTFITILQEMSVDPKVTSIKITLYRLASNSKIIDALCEAAENGKEVLVLVELRARFDEENNIEWSKLLQNSGCKVIYGPMDYKVHSKLLLVQRKVRDKIEYITQIGTGNYNEKTSRLYTDLSIITHNPEIAQDAESVFENLLKGSFVTETNHLLVAPLCLQNRVIEMIDDEMEKAKNGQSAYVAAKINSLSDKKIIDKLVEASQAGVKIELLVRGICCLIAGVEGYTENITVKSIVGRYLEHSRMYIFGTGNDTKLYISSADYMTRNTTKRVEVAVPILDVKLRKRLLDMFKTMMADNIKARVQGSDGIYIKSTLQPKEKPLNSQEYFYEEAYKKIADKNKRLKARQAKKTKK